MLEYLLDHCTKEAEDSDDPDAGVVNCFSKPSEVEEASAVSPSRPLSLSVLLGEEADDLSPRSISMLEAEEGAGKQVYPKHIKIFFISPFLTFACLSRAWKSCCWSVCLPERS